MAGALERKQKSARGDVCSPFDHHFGQIFDQGTKVSASNTEPQADLSGNITPPNFSPASCSQEALLAWTLGQITDAFNLSSSTRNTESIKSQRT